MKLFLRRLWLSLNYRWCKVEAYRASHRGETLMAADFDSRALDWQREYLMAGRGLV